MAVSPLASTAFTSAPSFKSNCAASSTSGSVPATSSASAPPIPTPHAAISGVQLSAFPSEGSAPNSTSNRMNATSSVPAAIRKGVAPRCVYRPAPPLPVFDCQDQRAGSFPRTFTGRLSRLHCLVHLGSCLEQCESRTSASFAHREKQWSESGIWQRRLDVGASFEQEIDDFGVTLCGGP